jgi:hypothetical protein
MVNNSETPADTNTTAFKSVADLHAALELRAKAESQLASYCEKLIVFGAGGVAGGVTVAAGIVTRLGRIEAYPELLVSFVCMGLSTAGAILVNFDCSSSSYIDLRLTASAKLDLGEMERLAVKRRFSPFQRWVRFTERLGKRSNSLGAAKRRLYATLVLAMLLFNGFLQYVIFVIANIRKFPH